MPARPVPLLLGPRSVRVLARPAMLSPPTAPLTAPGWWLQNGSANHSTSGDTVGTINGFRYQYTIDPGNVDPVARTGICTVTFTITPKANSQGGVQWASDPTLSPATRKFTVLGAGGGSVSMNAADCPAADAFFLWVTTGDASGAGTVDRWKFTPG